MKYKREMTVLLFTLSCLLIGYARRTNSSLPTSLPFTGNLTSDATGTGDNTTMGIKIDFIEQPVRFCFGKIGKFIGKHPWYFLIIPLFLSGLMGAGFFFLRERTSNDIEKEFTPLNGPGKSERHYMQETFPENKTMFSNLRLSTNGMYAKVILTHDVDILGKDALKDVLLIDKRIREMTDESLNYSGICAKVNHKCFSNKLLDIVKKNESIRPILNYPIHKFENESIHMGYLIGGVELEVDDATVSTAKAIQLFYYLQENNKTSDTWLTKLMNLRSNITSNTRQVCADRSSCLI